MHNRFINKRPFALNESKSKHKPHRMISELFLEHLRGFSLHFYEAMREQFQLLAENEQNESCKKFHWFRVSIGQHLHIHKFTLIKLNSFKQNIEKLHFGNNSTNRIKYAIYSCSERRLTLSFSSQHLSIAQMVIPCHVQYKFHHSKRFVWYSKTLI